MPPEARRCSPCWRAAAGRFFASHPHPRRPSVRAGRRSTLATWFATARGYLCHHPNSLRRESHRTSGCRAALSGGSPSLGPRRKRAPRRSLLPSVANAGRHPETPATAAPHGKDRMPPQALIGASSNARGRRQARVAHRPDRLRPRPHRLRLLDAPKAVGCDGAGSALPLKAQRVLARHTAAMVGGTHRSLHGNPRSTKQADCRRPSSIGS